MEFEVSGVDPRDEYQPKQFKDAEKNAEKFFNEISELDDETFQEFTENMKHEIGLHTSGRFVLDFDTSASLSIGRLNRRVDFRIVYITPDSDHLSIGIEYTG